MKAKPIKKLRYFVKNETVLSIAAVLAIISSFFVRPDREYIGYIDFRTLALLFCLMTVMAGLHKNGIFDFMAMKILKYVHGVRSLVFILVMLCFFSSMLITNDVALITFVPFTFTIIRMMGEENEGLTVPVVAMQTIAANLGSMLTPIGNPQNLYLQGISGMKIDEFTALMLPYAAISFIMLTLWTVCRKSSGDVKVRLGNVRQMGKAGKTAIYLISFAVCLMSVGRILDYKLTLLIVIILISAADYRIIFSIDYALLATFAAFFIFIGNMGRIPVFSGFLKSVISGRECITAVLSSQIISNVPAALLLSEFTNDIRSLIIGVNLGGLGTLIASMASLISFKLIGRKRKSMRGRYIVYFTAANVIFLIILLGAYLLIEHFA